MLAWGIQLVSFVECSHVRFVNDVKLFLIAEVASLGDGVVDASPVNIPPFYIEDNLLLL